MKHTSQVASILELLQKLGLMRPNTCFVEFGSGRGKFRLYNKKTQTKERLYLYLYSFKGAVSFWLGKVIEQQKLQNCHVVLIDKTSPKHKQDNKLKYDDTDVKLNVVRIRAGIEDVELANIEAVKVCENIVGVAKHLCGDGTGIQ